MRHGLPVRKPSATPALPLGGARPLIGAPPLPHGVDDGLEGEAEVSEAVLDAWRHLGEDLALEDACRLEVSQVRGEHLLAHAADGALELAEALGTGEQLVCSSLLIDNFGI